MHVKLIEAKLRGELNQQDFEAMRDVLFKDITEIESAHRAMIQEAEAALLLTCDTTRTSIPAKALWASAHLTEKLTVQNALFPEGILYRTDIGFFEPPDDRLSALVFRLLIELSEHGEAYEYGAIQSFRGEWI